MPLVPGLTATVEATVTSADTALALGSGDVAVLGTPRVLAMMEAASIAAIKGELEAGQTSVGVHADLEHLVPSAVGDNCSAEARLLSVDGRRLVFAVRVHDSGDRLLATGRIVRALVDRERFLSRT